jgi:hypothetical protein
MFLLMSYILFGYCFIGGRGRLVSLSVYRYEYFIIRHPLITHNHKKEGSLYMIDMLTQSYESSYRTHLSKPVDLSDLYWI